MKKWMAVLSALALAAACTACSKSNESDENTVSDVIHKGDYYAAGAGEAESGVMRADGDSNIDSTSDSGSSRYDSESSMSSGNSEGNNMTETKNATTPGFYADGNFDEVISRYPDAIPAAEVNPIMTPEELSEQIEKSKEKVKAERKKNDASGTSYAGNAGNVPVDKNGNPLLPHGDTTLVDKYASLPDGLHKEACYNQTDVQTLYFDGVEMQVGTITGNQFFATAEHEWSRYSEVDDNIDTLEPGEKTAYHIDSPYFSSSSNRKKGISKKNGQVVFHVVNNSDTAMSVFDCVIYKISISYSLHGIADYNELPIVRYFGKQILDDAADIRDNSYFGEPRDETVLYEDERDIWRKYYGTMTETSVSIDTIEWDDSDIFAGITISCNI